MKYLIKTNTIKYVATSRGHKWCYFSRNTFSQAYLIHYVRFIVPHLHAKIPVLDLENKEIQVSKNVKLNRCGEVQKSLLSEKFSKSELSLNVL